MAAVLEIGKEVIDRFRLLDVPVGAQEGAHGEILFHRKAQERVVGLGHVAHAQTDDLMGRHAGDVRIVVRYRSLARFQQSEDRLHERGLAAAVGADDGYHFPSAN